ncbi:MAG: hypothetical protein ABIQ73_12455 [Acidimicrobiales bacterium]
MREDDIEFYFEQVKAVCDRKENATLDAIRRQIGPTAEPHLKQLQESLNALVERKPSLT